MALADEIEKLVRRKPGLTQMDLARMLHGRAGYKQQVNLTCRRLVAEGRLERKGRGGWGDPFTYYPPRIKHRAGGETHPAGALASLRRRDCLWSLAVNRPL